MLWLAVGLDVGLPARQQVEHRHAPAQVGQPVLLGPAQVQRLEAVADPGGAFRFRLPAAGTYLLDVVKEGYFAVQGRPVYLTEGDNEVACPQIVWVAVLSDVVTSTQVPLASWYSRSWVGSV